MIATDTARDNCQLGNKRVTYTTLQRNYRCAECGGRLVIKMCTDETYALSRWPECGRCGGRDFIHERKEEQQRSDAIEVLAGLPRELAALIE